MIEYICTMNYFELFGLPISLQVDKKELSKKYFGLQKKFHPDFFAQSDEEEQRVALETSSLANKALKVLQSPHQTIQYVLQLKGLIKDDQKYQLPPAFLMEMMELNEKLVEQSPEDFRKELAELEAEIDESAREVIENYDDTAVSDQQLSTLHEYYFKKKYLQRILDRLDD